MQWPHGYFDEPDLRIWCNNIGGIEGVEKSASMSGASRGLAANEVAANSVAQQKQAPTIMRVMRCIRYSIQKKISRPRARGDQVVRCARRARDGRRIQPSLVATKSRESNTKEFAATCGPKFSKCVTAAVTEPRPMRRTAEGRTRARRATPRRPRLLRPHRPRAGAAGSGLTGRPREALFRYTINCLSCPRTFINAVKCNATRGHAKQRRYVFMSS